MRHPGYYWYYPTGDAPVAGHYPQIVRVEIGYEAEGQQDRYVLVIGERYGYRLCDCPGEFVGPLVSPSREGDVDGSASS